MNYADYLNPHDEYDPTAGQIMFTPRGEPTLKPERGGLIVTQEMVVIIASVRRDAQTSSKIFQIAEDETQNQPIQGILQTPKMGVSNNY